MLCLDSKKNRQVILAFIYLTISFHTCELGLKSNFEPNEYTKEHIKKENKPNEAFSFQLATRSTNLSFSEATIVSRAREAVLLKNQVLDLPVHSMLPTTSASLARRRVLQRERNMVKFK